MTWIWRCVIIIITFRDLQSQQMFTHSCVHCCHFNREVSPLYIYYCAVENCHCLFCRIKMDRFVPVVCHSARMYCLFWSVICWYTILLYRYFCKSQIGPFYMFKKKKKKKESSLTLSFSPQQTTEYQSLHQGYSQYESLSLSLLRRKKEAETTLLFWKTHSGKTTVSTTLLSYLNLLTPCHLLCGWKKKTLRDLTLPNYDTQKTKRVCSLR